MALWLATAAATGAVIMALEIAFHGLLRLEGVLGLHLARLSRAAPSASSTGELLS